MHVPKEGRQGLDPLELELDKRELPEWVGGSSGRPARSQPVSHLSSPLNGLNAV